jgi:hypothetical protein
MIGGMAAIAEHETDGLNLGFGPNNPNNDRQFYRKSHSSAFFPHNAEFPHSTGVDSASLSWFVRD